MRLSVILAIARKDIVDALRNYYVLFGIVFPLGIWLLFRVLVPGGSDLKIGPIAVYDQGNSRLAQQLKAQPLVGRVIETRSFDELAEVVRKEAVGGLSLPVGFDEAVSAERSPELTVLVNSRRGGGELAAFRRIVDNQVRDLAGRPPVVRLVERDVNDAGAGSKPEGFVFQGFIFASLLVTSLAMTGVFVVPTLLVEEKEKGTLKAILVSPATYGDVVAGKAVAGLFYALTMAVVLVGLNDGLRGNVPLLALGIVLGSLLLVEVGLLMGAVFNTSNQLNTWSSIVMLLLITPSWTMGVWVPSTVEPALRLLPSYYLVQLIRMAGNSVVPADLLVDAGVLMGCIAVFSTAIVWVLRRAER